MTSWQDLRLVSVDTETTGPDPSTARLLEFAAWRFSRGIKPSGWSTLIDVGAEGEDPFRAPCQVGESTAIHGITQADINAAPRLGEYVRCANGEPVRPVRTFAEEIADRCVGVIVGYNVARYDLPVLCRELRPHLEIDRIHALESSPVIDVLTWVWSIDRYVAGSGRHKLAVAAERWGVEVPKDLHRAAADAMLTIRLLAKIRDRLPSDLGELIETQAALAAEREADFAAYKERVKRNEETTNQNA